MSPHLDIPDHKNSMNLRDIQKHSCSFCDSERMSLVMDFGDVALAGGFLKPEQFHQEQKYPLRVYFCNDCFAVQVVDKVPADILFHNYFYFSSSINTLKEHFANYAVDVTSRFLEPATSTVLEFGCNDGVLLRPLADQGIRTVIGVDPAKNVVASIDDPRVTVINAFFTEETAENIVNEFGEIDMIMANNVYAHIPDIQGTTRAVKKALSDDGVFIFEVHYLGNVIDEMQYDMIYHEHLYYYSLLSVQTHFERYDMLVFDIESIPIHAGSMRFYICNKSSYHSARISDRVSTLADEERAKGFDKFESYKRFSEMVAEHRDRLLSLLDKLKQSRNRIAGYGASGRANTMIQYCGINHTHLDYVIDDAPAKIGYFTPGSHFEVVSSSVLSRPDAPDYILVFAWSFIEEIRRRNADYLSKGRHMIIPLPSVGIIPEIN